MIIFLRTRWNYDSYTDYWKLVELSGFPIQYIDEADLTGNDNTYILSPMNGEWRPHLSSIYPDLLARRKMGSQVVLWNLERPGGSGSLQAYIKSGQDLITDGVVDRIWVSDQNLARDTGFEYVTLGGHPGLGEPGAVADKKYDLIHLSCYSPRRSLLFKTPSEPHKVYYGWTIAPNGWGAERLRRRAEYAAAGAGRPEERAAHSTANCIPRISRKLGR